MKYAVGMDSGTIIHVYEVLWRWVQAFKSWEDPQIHGQEGDLVSLYNVFSLSKKLEIKGFQVYRISGVLNKFCYFL
jgi:hypothetical protein